MPPSGRERGNQRFVIDRADDSVVSVDSVDSIDAIESVDSVDSVLAPEPPRLNRFFHKQPTTLATSHKHAQQAHRYIPQASDRFHPLVEEKLHAKSRSSYSPNDFKTIYMPPPFPHSYGRCSRRTKKEDMYTPRILRCELLI